MMISIYYSSNKHKFAVVARLNHCLFNLAMIKLLVGLGSDGGGWGTECSARCAIRRWKVETFAAFIAAMQ